jgi:NADPH:quinone reductase-like Zn-dependent oxidoreductase
LIVAVGPDVPQGWPHLSSGAAVFSRVPNSHRGTVASHVVVPASAVALKPRTLSHVESAALPLVTLTAMQSFDLALAHFRSNDLSGKTVLIPAGLSGTGATALQLAKRVYKASKVITTVSTGKMSKIGEVLGEGVADLIVDYTKQDLRDTLQGQQVDVIFDTVGNGPQLLPLVRQGGVVVSIAGAHFGPTMRQLAPNMPFYAKVVLEAMGAVIRTKACWFGVQYIRYFMHDSGDDLTRAATWVDDGLLRPVVGTIANMQDLETIKQQAQMMLDGKGGFGKFVLRGD